MKDDEHLYLEGESLLGFGIDRIPGSGPGSPGPSAADGLTPLAEKVRECRSCPLWEHRTQTVFGAGSLGADLMFVGEAPGMDEDREGIPFVGRAGQLLTRMIKAMGYERDEVYIANILKCRPPNNRTPTAREMASCRGYLDEQIRIIRPKVIVTLGTPAVRTLLGGGKGINALRGHSYPLPGNSEILVVPTFHPAYLLRNETEKAKAWLDLKLALALLKG